MPTRPAFSLMELILVLTLVGLLGTLAVTRLDVRALGNLGAEGDARRLALAMLQAQRRAISTGDNHYVGFNSSGGQVTGFTVFRRTAGGDVAVDSVHDVEKGVTMTVNAAVAEFNFEGAALASYVATISGDDRSWTVTVVPVTGTIVVVET